MRAGFSSREPSGAAQPCFSQPALIDTGSCFLLSQRGDRQERQHVPYDGAPFAPLDPVRNNRVRRITACQLLVCASVRRYLHLRGKKCVSEPGILDNQETFIEMMAPQESDKGLSDEERVVAMSVHLLACCLDGDFGHSQRDLWKELCDAAGPIAEYYEDRVLFMTTRCACYALPRPCHFAGQDLGIFKACLADVWVAAKVPRFPVHQRERPA